ncbi:hypothetical protein [Frankia gtarii]|uniref:hypothetical protein n=1 Tax=Frankia gtarii TaxID=2950102 RepID=UPI0021BF4E28|nr:hypothetical protein [Frankia gtarii]
MAPTVVVVDGGYGGITVAKAPDEVSDVVLVESRDAFVHNVATLRGVVDPGWAELQSGTRIAADCVVLATGSAYPYPAKIDAVDSGSAISTLRGTHDGVARAGRAPSRVTTEAGEDITVDVWFACYGASVDSDYLDTPSCARPGSPTGGWPSPRNYGYAARRRCSRSGTSPRCRN